MVDPNFSYNMFLCTTTALLAVSDTASAGGLQVSRWLLIVVEIVVTYINITIVCTYTRTCIFNFNI